MFRKAIREGTELGRSVKTILDNGQLVPDSLTVEVVDHELNRVRSGFILDGFPRTVKQAEALDDLLVRRGLKIDLAVFLDVPQEALVSRLAGRRVCEGCGRVYHVEASPPRKEGVCDACGGKVVQRRDDSEEVVRRRIEAYENQTYPLREFYSARPYFAAVDGLGSSDEVRMRLTARVEAISHCL